MSHLAVNTYPMMRRKPRQLKPSNKYLVEALGKNWATVVVWIAVLSVTLPVFRSGGRTNLTLVDWIRNHSIWGPPVEYVPIENYARELEGAWLDEEGNLRW